MTPLEIVLTITGVLGSITGVTSLVWHILKSKSKLRLKRAHFTHKIKKGSCMEEGYEKVIVKIVLRNMGHRSTTIDSLWITYGSHEIPPFFQEVIIPACTSKILNYTLNFKEGELKRMFPEGKIKIGLDIIHTFGKIRKEGETTLKEEYYNF